MRYMSGLVLECHAAHIHYGVKDARVFITVGCVCVYYCRVRVNCLRHSTYCKVTVSTACATERCNEGCSCKLALKSCRKHVTPLLPRQSYVVGAYWRRLWHSSVFGNLSALTVWRGRASCHHRKPPFRSRLSVNARFWAPEFGARGCSCAQDHGALGSSWRACSCA